MKMSLIAASALFLLSGCAAPLPRMPGDLAPQLLRDDWYPRTAQVAGALIPAERVFDLGPELESQLDLARQRLTDPNRRLNYLMHEIFGDDFQDFDYLASITTPAAQTFARKGGNCLSLTILAMSMAERLGFSAQMQEVKVPLNWQRNGRFDFINRHVNVLLRRPASMQLNAMDISNNVIIDFDPDAARRMFAARALSREDVLAMFYNNLAAEAQARGDARLAYANLREALRHQPAFDSAWINLAALYRQRGREGLAPAEASLNRALAIKPDSYAGLTLLVTVLKEQQRLAEASAVEQRLNKLKSEDPHRQFALAEQAAVNGDHRNAARILADLVKRASGYVEFHELLAQSYAALGDDAGAKREQETVRQLRSGPTRIGMQFKKIERMTQ